MQTLDYPIKFRPILKTKIWGGEKLKLILNKTTNAQNVGESWEISDVDHNVSLVTNGHLKGKSLKSLLKQFKDHLVGDKNYKVFGAKFPLLIKFIDAKADLSVQLHPDNELAKKRHKSFGKTEMWYVMQADPKAKLIVGFNKKITPKTYLKHLEQETLTSLLNFDKVTSGDTYFIEAGRIHAIGAGVLLAEIQQTSDVTYRVHDWNRVDAQGNERELHNDLAIEAINFDMQDNFRIQYSKQKNNYNTMLSCPYFTTNYIDLDTTLTKINTHDSFLIYICVEGQASITSPSKIVTIVKGETVLVPAILKSFTISAKNAKLLEVYV